MGNRMLHAAIAYGWVAVAAMCCVWGSFVEAALCAVIFYLHQIAGQLERSSLTTCSNCEAELVEASKWETRRGI